MRKTENLLNFNKAIKTFNQ